MNKEQLAIIKELHEILESAINDKRTEYTHTVSEGNQEWTETINREKQLQFICEVVSERLVNNFEWENE
ncbi:hypothetical protein M3595_09540 [Staphylococcus warneri]|uniref:Pathogenicity island protein n=1 Tax=Staphylococcus warneri TaxID=1292 RepID=A0A8B2ZIV1_STAWA|nr:MULTISPECIES: hypothetical protein [Staphylococcus]PAK73048.1 hypothetical protein B8W95_07165 [Staphylococcus pasteuri]DAW86965.1 MAG TPA: hypothetical protein [Bacteriophage sp.]EGG96117.1 hypothetical protein SEVCU121_0659 [Staphylococcus warneri VCU121]KKI61036.1 hypothetical protein UF68_2227 [Staphylococcus warneri]KTW21106.1 membrane protein [Staphylococcus warneri]